MPTASPSRLLVSFAGGGGTNDGVDERVRVRVALRLFVAVTVELALRRFVAVAVGLALAAFEVD